MNASACVRAQEQQKRQGALAGQHGCFGSTMASYPYGDDDDDDEMFAGGAVSFGKQPMQALACAMPADSIAAPRITTIPKAGTPERTSTLSCSSILGEPSPSGLMVTLFVDPPYKNYIN